MKEEVYLRLEQLGQGQVETGPGMSNARLDVLGGIRGRRYSCNDLKWSEDEDVFRLLRLTFNSVGRVQVFARLSSGTC